MEKNTEQTAAAAATGGHLEVRNSGEPLRFQNVERLAGFALEPAKQGQQVAICTRRSITSDEPLFHRLVENLAAVIQHLVQSSGSVVDLRRADMVLLVFRPDSTAELWVDSAAVSLSCRVKRAVAAGSMIFDGDVADVTSMNFPCVSIGGKDGVLCLFREGWSFGLAFDFNPDGDLDLTAFSNALGTLYRKLHYRHLYETVNDPVIFPRLQAAGWFPFVEIIASEFRDLARYVESEFDLAEIEAKIVAAFDAERLAHLFERWAAKPHFAAKAALLKEAVEAFSAQKPASVIKIVLTEIEGVLNDAFKLTHGGHGAKLRELLTFARASAEARTGGQETLYFPAAFGSYLASHTFANFDPAAQVGSAGSRHAVGHGAAVQESYTMTRALQAILTLDQLAFYT